MLQEQLKVIGDVSIQVYGADGYIKDSREIKNLVVDVGKNFIASRIVGTPTVMSHMAVGSGAVAAAAGNTVLGTELARVALSSVTATNAVVTFTASFPAGIGTGAISEAGIFNALSAGTMLCRTAFAVVNKSAIDAMSITWQITVA
jgi:hypothetical protein